MIFVVAFGAVVGYGGALPVPQAAAVLGNAIRQQVILSGIQVEVVELVIFVATDILGK